MAGEATVFEYMYRDASNYKRYERVIFAGTLSDADRERFLASPHAERFIPEQIGLANPREQFESHFDDDHIWCETVRFTVCADVEPTDTRTIEEFVEQFFVTVWDPAIGRAALAQFVQNTREGQ